VHESTNFPKIFEPPRNSRYHKADMKQVLYWGLRNIRRHHTKFWCVGDLTPRICTSLV